MKILRLIPATIVLGLFTFIANAPAASFLHIEGEINVGSGTTTPADVISQTAGTGPLTGQITDSFTKNTDDSPSDSASANLYADYGLLQLQAMGQSTKGAEGNFAGPGSFGSYVGGSPVANYSDTFVVTSQSLTNGTPVTLAFTLTFSGALTADNPDEGGGISDGVAGLLSVNPGLAGQPRITVGPGQTSATTNYVVHVGDSVTITSGLYAGAGNNGNDMHNGQTFNWAIAGGFGSYASVTTMINVLTVGAAYTTSSGKTYTTAPPKLQITESTATSVTVSWPSNASGFALQYNTDMTTTNWLSFVGTINDNGTTKSVTINYPTGNEFFRLQK